ncbi:MAG: serine--tRNA ligase, partial [Methylococcaceae bacterium]|nr:serine--tRNA ligase [Methylococcaceae bacterium]
MLDPRLIRSDIDLVVAQLARRSFPLDTAAITELETRRRDVQARTQSLQNERNSRSKLIGQAKARGEDLQPLLAEAESFGDRLKKLESELDEIQTKLENLLLGIPNILDPDVPEGRSEADNVEVYRWSEPRQFDFPPKDHVELGAYLGLMDFEAAAKIAGARFVALHGPLCRLQRAMSQFMVDLHTQEHGYTETY